MLSQFPPRLICYLNHFSNEAPDFRDRVAALVQNSSNSVELRANELPLFFRKFIYVLFVCLRHSFSNSAIFLPYSLDSMISLLRPVSTSHFTNPSGRSGKVCSRISLRRPWPKTSGPPFSILLGAGAQPH